MSDKYIAMYLRVSDDDDDLGEDKNESNSIVNQRKLLQDFIQKDKELSRCLVKEYQDDGYSGVNFNRPGIQQVLSDVREGKILCIIVKDLSRFGRNYIEAGDYIEQIFPFMNVRFISVSDHYDSSVDMGGLEIGFKNLMHDLYSRDLSQKIKSVRKMYQKKGIYAGGSVPFGYILSDDGKKSFQIDEEAAVFVKRIFGLALEGKSTTEIAKCLNEEGVPPRGEYMKKKTGINYDKKNLKSNMWTSIQVADVIRNEIYMGTYVGGKLSTVRPREVKRNARQDYIRVENHHDSIVDRDTFEKAQSAVKKRKARGTYKVDYSAALKGVLRCGRCGYLLSRNSQRKQVYFYCRMGILCDSRVKIAEEELEQRILKELQPRLEKCKVDIDEKKDKIKMLDGRLRDAKEEQRMLGIKMDNSKGKRLSLYRRWKDGELSRDEYRMQRDEGERVEEGWKGRLENLGREIEEIEKKKSELSLEKKAVAADKLTRELVEQFIEIVDVYGDGRMEIGWKE